MEHTLSSFNDSVLTSRKIDFVLTSCIINIKTTNQCKKQHHRHPATIDARPDTRIAHTMEESDKEAANQRLLILSGNATIEGHPKHPQEKDKQ